MRARQRHVLGETGAAIPDAPDFDEVRSTLAIIPSASELLAPLAVLEVLLGTPRALDGSDRKSVV